MVPRRRRCGHSSRPMPRSRRSTRSVARSSSRSCCESSRRASRLRSRMDVPRAGARSPRGGHRIHAHELPRAPGVAPGASRTGGAPAAGVPESLARAAPSRRAAGVDGQDLGAAALELAGEPLERIDRWAGGRVLRAVVVGLGGEVEAVAVAATAEGDVGPFAVDAVGGQDVGVVDGEPLGDVAGDGVAVHERRVAGGGRLGKEVPVEPDPATAVVDLDRAACRVDVGDAAAIAVVDIAPAIVALDDDLVADGERARPAYRARARARRRPADAGERGR